MPPSAKGRRALGRSTGLVSRSRENLDGFQKVGLGYERKGFGARTWRIFHWRGGFRVQLEPLDFYNEDPRRVEWEDALSCWKPLVDDFSPTLSNAVALARIWDEKLDR